MKKQILLIVTIIYLLNFLGVATEITKKDVLSVQSGNFFLEGKPFAEISFNKFDLIWSIWSSAKQGDVIDAANPIVKKQDEALRELSANGFRTIRVFGMPYRMSDYWTIYSDKERRNSIYYKAIDKSLELCQKHHLKVVFTLGCTAFANDFAKSNKANINDGSEEDLSGFLSNPKSSMRQKLNSYLDETINRYKNNKAIAMWEIANELTNLADLPQKKNGEKQVTMQVISDFYSDVTAKITSIDTLRLVNHGGSHLREHAYGLANGKGWKERDSYSDHLSMYKMVNDDPNNKVIDIHYYAVAEDGYEIRDDAGYPFFLNLKEYKKIADTLGKPLYLGEYAALPKDKTPNKKNDEFWKLHPDYFETFDGDNEAAQKWVQKALDDLVESGISLTHLWCYQSDREMDQKDPQRMDLDLQRTPVLFKMVVVANKKLKAKIIP